MIDEELSANSSGLDDNLVDIDIRFNVSDPRKGKLEWWLINSHDREQFAYRSCSVDLPDPQVSHASSQAATRRERRKKK
jgi:hypothetical protein